MLTLNQLNALDTNEFIRIAENDNILLYPQMQESALYHLGELKDIEDNSISMSYYKDNVNEILSQLPADDFLDKTIDIIDTIINSKLKKTEIIELVKDIKSNIEEIKEEQIGANEYANDEFLKNLK